MGRVLVHGAKVAEGRIVSLDVQLGGLPGAVGCTTMNPFGPASCRMRVWRSSIGPSIDQPGTSRITPQPPAAHGSGTSTSNAVSSLQDTR